jgi:hypothetical protein
MSAVKNFEKLYNFNPFDFAKRLNKETFEFMKSVGLDRLIPQKVNEYYGIEESAVDNTFFKYFAECFQEAGERFPQNLKISYPKMEMAVSPLNPTVSKSKGILEDFKEIVSDDDLRPVMTGVYLSEDEYAVGTDGHCLVKDFVGKTEYYNKFKNKIVDLTKYLKSKGEVLSEIDGIYPKYDAVIPKNSDAKYKIQIDLYELYNLCKSSAFYLKLFDSNNVIQKLKIKDEIFGVNPIVCLSVVDYYLKKGSKKTTLYYHAPNKAIVMEFGASVGLVMPVMIYDDSTEGFRDSVVVTEAQNIEQLSEFSGGNKPSQKPSAQKPISSRRVGRPSKPRASEVPTEGDLPPNFVEELETVEDYRKYSGKFKGDNTYIPRREIAKIVLKDGTTLTTNQIIDGVYKANKKFAGGGEFAKGGMTEHGLKSGDKIVRSISANTVEIYNKYLRQVGTVNLNNGTRNVRKF